MGGAGLVAIALAMLALSWWPLGVPPEASDLPPHRLIAASVNSSASVHRPPSPHCPAWTAEDADSSVRSYSDPLADFVCPSVADEDLAPQSSPFHASLCRHITDCWRGAVVVARKNASACEEMVMLASQIIVDDSDLNSRIIRDWGPDFFYLVFDGPARVVPPSWQHVGNCKTIHPFSLLQRGNYSLSLEWTHTNYSAVAEFGTRGIHPTPVSEPEGRHILIETSLQVCSHCPRFVPAQLRQQMTKAPQCSRTKPVPGVYLNSNDFETPDPFDMRRYQIHGLPYTWIPVGCRFDQFFDGHSDDACFGFGPSSRSFMLLGDSHSHRFWDAVDRRLVGTMEPYIFGDKTIWYQHYSGRLENTHQASASSQLFLERIRNDTGFPTDQLHPDPRVPVSPNVTVTYYWSVFLDEFTDQAPLSENDLKEFWHHLSNQKVIVFQTGAWPASTVNRGGHWTIASYSAQMRKIARAIQNFKATIPTDRVAPTFVWAGPTSMKIQDKDPEPTYEETGDWRNPHRLRLYRDAAAQVFDAAGIARTDWFALTHPFIRESPDGAHFPNLPASDAVVDDILHRFDICKRHGSDVV
ncbi:hypothetical protein HDU82_000881 [Entophlyctis luteolus]|nr:hypothetical protein HDU82_000881 [Entophlyctis luteolus]